METNTGSGPAFFIEPGRLEKRRLEPGLYIVPTPIGNLGDITLRALQTLASCDVIACEDTRVTGKLLQRFGISTRMTAYHEHNAVRQGPHLVAMIEDGGAVALASDAGTPLVSDPGYRLVTDALQAGCPVVPLPGASSAITALTASGLATDSFLFVGFFPVKEGKKRERLNAFSTIPATLIFFESPNRIADTLTLCADVLGPDRQGVVGREITKLHESFTRDTLSGLAEAFQAMGSIKGEIVLLVGPPGAQTIDIDTVDDTLRALLKTHRVKEASEIASDQTGLSKREIYQRALMLKDDNGE